MGRPKGSKNKTKHVEPVKETPIETVKEYTPKPDMGAIKPPPESAKDCACGHKKAVHYGPSREWCNTQGCKCQDFSAK